MKALVLTSLLTLLAGPASAQIIPGLPYPSSNLNHEIGSGAASKPGIGVQFQGLVNLKDVTMVNLKRVDESDTLSTFTVGKPGSPSAMKLVVNQKTYKLIKGFVGNYGVGLDLEQAQPIPWNQPLDYTFNSLTLAFERVPDATEVFDLIEGARTKEGRKHFTIHNVKLDTSIKGVLDGVGQMFGTGMRTVPDLPPPLLIALSEPTLAGIRQRFTEAQILAGLEAKRAEMDRLYGDASDPESKLWDQGMLEYRRILLGEAAVQPLEPELHKKILSFGEASTSSTLKDLLAEYIHVYPNGKNIEAVKARFRKHEKDKD